MTKKEFMEFAKSNSEQRTELKMQAREMLVKALEQTGTVRFVHFDEDTPDDEREYDSPCIDCTGMFGDGTQDCYVVSARTEQGHILLNLHAYYLGEDATDVDMDTYCSADYAFLLDFVIDMMNEDGTQTH